MIKSKSVIQIMKSLERGVTVLRGVLLQEEIEKLMSIYNDLCSDSSLYRSRASVGTKKNQVTNVPDTKYQDIDNIIRSKLNLLPFQYESMNFYKIQNAYHLHSDTGKNNSIGYQQGVIPLEIDSNGSKPCTVIFNERVYFSSEYVQIDKKHPKQSTYEPFYNVGTWDTSYYEGWTDEYKMSDGECQRIWYSEWEHWKECYKGFSVNTIYEWEVGDILLFDRSLLHASGLLEAGGINYKSGLLFLTHVEQ